MKSFNFKQNIHEDTEGNKALQVIYRKTLTDELYYGTAELVGDFIKNENISATPTFYLLSEHVSDIKMELITTTGEDGLAHVKQVKVTLVMEQNNITNTTQKTIALRNQPLGTYKWTMSLQADSGTVAYPTATPTPEATQTPIS